MHSQNDVHCIHLSLKLFAIFNLLADNVPTSVDSEQFCLSVKKAAS